MPKKKIRYEDRVSEVDNEIRKRRPKWRLSALSWVDFDDVSQIIRFHIFKKWDQWDQSRDLLPWINKIISNQFKNILRNYYHTFVKPCTLCPLNGTNEEENTCTFTKSGLQDSTCPLYKKWEKSKKYACNVKMPVSIEDVGIAEPKDFNFSRPLEEDIRLFNEKMKKELTEKQFKVYEMLFISKMTEEEVALKLGYKTNEKNRKAGYKQIKNLKIKLKQVGENIIKRRDLFL